MQKEDFSVILSGFAIHRVTGKVPVTHGFANS